MRVRAFVVLVAALVGAAVTARLGWWQLDRAAQKTALQAQREARTALPPLPLEALARTAEAAAAQHDRRVVLEGVWLAGHTVHLDNRQMDARQGFVVVTPLALPDGAVVVVQRGWVPRDFQDRTRLTTPPPPGGTVRVEGRIAPPPARLYALGGPETGPIRQNLDLAHHATEIRRPLLPLSVVQEDGAQPVRDGLLRRWPPPATGVSKHHGYAFQWFALSALILGLYVWFQLLRPRRPR